MYILPNNNNYEKVKKRNEATENRNNGDRTVVLQREMKNMF